MTDALDPRDELTERLRALGRQPVDPALQSAHLTAMAAVPRASSWRGMVASRVKIGAALAGGFLLGATGLASAGAMGPLQPIAETTVEAVTPFDLPAASKGGQDTAKAAKAKAKADRGNGDATDDSDDTAEPKNWVGCALTFGGKPASQENRGQYLKDARENGTPAEFEAARRSDCGKSVSAVDGTDDTDGDDDADARKPSGQRGKSADDKGKTSDDDSTDDDSTDDDSTDDDGTDDGDASGRDRSGTNAGKSGVTAPPTSTPVQPAPEKRPADGSGQVRSGNSGRGSVGDRDDRDDSDDDVADTEDDSDTRVDSSGSGS